MALTRNIAVALAAGGLAITSLAPASAQHHGGGHHGENGGYVKHNHKGYSGTHHPAYNGHHGYKDYGRGPPPKHYSYHKHVYKHYVPPHNYRPRYHYNHAQRVIYAPQYGHYYKPNYRYIPRYQLGHRIYSGGYTYVIHDYHRYGLYVPPHGHQWVRHDGDAYLIAAGTGLVAGIIIGAMLGY